MRTATVIMVVLILLFRLTILLLTGGLCYRGEALIGG